MTHVTIMNPDNGLYILTYKNPTTNLYVPTDKIPANATASTFASFLKKYY